jgi:hypothetical protein
MNSLVDKGKSPYCSFQSSHEAFGKTRSLQKGNVPPQQQQA